MSSDSEAKRLEREAFMQKELDEIMKEFHALIEEQGHCYERETPEGRARCECVDFYERWVDTKKKYQTNT